jgi:hypothetical protein
MSFIVSPITNRKIKYLHRSHKDQIRKEFLKNGINSPLLVPPFLPKSLYITSKGYIKRKPRNYEKGDDIEHNLNDIDIDKQLTDIVSTKDKRKKTKELAKLKETLNKYQLDTVIRLDTPYKQTLYNIEGFNSTVYRVNGDYALNPETFEKVARVAISLYNRQTHNKKQYITMRINFKNGNDHNSNITIDNRTLKLAPKAMYKYVMEVLQNYYDKQSQSDLNITVHSFSFLVVNDPSLTGGCNCGKNDLHPTFKTEMKLMKKGTTRIKCLNPMSTKNNCGIMCILKRCGIKGNELKPEIIRKALNIKEGVELTMSQLGAIVNYICEKYNRSISLSVCDFKGDLIYSSYPLNRNRIEENIMIMLRSNHYFLIEHIEKYCGRCNKYYIKEPHPCNQTNVNFVNKKIRKKKDRIKQVDIRNPNNKKPFDYNKLITYDLETLQESYKQEPYACGWTIGHENVKITYGKDCIKPFVEEILNLEGHIITAYNTAKFDSYFLLDEFISRGDVVIENLIMNSGKIMSFQFHKEGMKPNKVFDLCLFIMTSLNDACKKFETMYQKGEFDHNKMKCWADTETHKEEVVKYLESDVLSLRSLFIKFNDTLYEAERANITDYITLSNMAYTLWGSVKYLKVLEEFKTYIELFDNVLDEDGNIIESAMKKHRFTTRACYGGRTYPMKREFISSAWQTIKEKNELRKKEGMDSTESNKIAYQELLESKDYVFNADATSLYPTCMKYFKYPVGASRWSNEPEKEFRSGTMGIYEVSFTCPRDIRYAYLPRKKENGGIEWSLYNGRGVYTSVDISTAEELGYKFNFVGECLVWDLSIDALFSDYVDTWYSIKEKATREGNKVMKAVAKLFLNGLYGKMLQRPVLSNTKICNTVNDVFDFYNEYDIKDWSVVGSDKLILKGETKELQQGDKINKPSYLGAFILSYTRKHMLKFVLAIDPTLRSCMFNYTDTDSAHISGESHIKLAKMGLIKKSSESELGMLCNDIDHEGLIFYEKCVAPKTYIYYYINELGEIKEKENGIMKCKAIPQNKLKVEHFDDGDDIDRKISFFTMKRVHTKINSKQEAKGITHFTIYNDTIKRQFSTKWTGMTLVENNFYPLGYFSNA